MRDALEIMKRHPLLKRNMAGRLNSMHLDLSVEKGNDAMERGRQAR